MKNWVKHLGFGLIILLLIGYSCRKPDDFTTDPSDKLEFSLDTLRFDTVFTSLGSATRLLKIYNTANQSIKISSIRIASGANSKFRINVDGIPGNEIEDVEILANDSIYIFGEVTIDPDQPLSASPFVITDELLFETNGNMQSVVLEAWGQNANYIPSRFGKGGVALLSCDLNEVVWDDPKPYVIYGILVIDSCTLRIPAGTQVYVHGGIAQTFDADSALVAYNDGLIYALPAGKIRVEGTLDDPVVFQGDRLEEPFSEVEGQWVGIRLASQGNTFEYVEVKNSLLGILVDSAAQLSLRNSRIYNTSGPGLVGQHALIDATNCLFYNNGSFSVQLGYGGDYAFDYCTLASYGVDAPALSLSNGVCYDPLCQEFDIYRLNANFRNSIIFGSRRDEISLSDFNGGMDPGSFNISLENCLVRVDELLDPEEGGYPDFLLSQCNPCINGTALDAIFVDPDEDDYQLDTLSLAEGQALPINGILQDLIENDRDPQNPDIGCFEYQYE